MTASVMIQGTCSNAGKSLLVAGLCRAFSKRGLSVRPFKPQNMSNNAAATPDGGEIGRAQALQALACRVPAERDMNPILLKPESDRGAQVIVRGEVRTTCNARDYHRLKPTLLANAISSFDTLCAQADLVVVEGAGSPAEVNLRQGDIANMGFALPTRTPVVLCGDIERGGVIAALVGTCLLLSAEEREITKGFIVNKFRGDPRLFDDALPIIEQQTGMSSLGVVPWFDKARLLPAEDVLDMQTHSPAKGTRIVVPRLPRIANFDDLDPLAQEADVSLSILELDQPLPGDTDLVILPGSKSTIADLDALRAHGWDIDLKAHQRRGGMILGLCGGYQMLGRTISDPEGLEGPPREVVGLGLLDVDTVLTGPKTVREYRGTEIASGLNVVGYEIHLGQTVGTDTGRPMLESDGKTDGARDETGRVGGCYVHGLFRDDRFRHAFLSRIAMRSPDPQSYDGRIDGVLDELAQHLEASLDLNRIYQIATSR